MQLSPCHDDQFRSVAENAPEGILVAQGFDRPYLFANRCAGELSGYTESELLTLTPSHLIPPDECARIRENMEMRLSGEAVPETYETTLVRKDGLAVPVEITGSRIPWQGRPAVLILVRDISRHKQMESELERRIQERTANWRMTAEALEAKQYELAVRRQELDRINKELVKTNTALSVLARNIDRRRDELEKKIAMIVCKRIMPLVNELRIDHLPDKSQAKIEVLASLLGGLTAEQSKSHDVLVSLSSAELRVAVMIKNGLSSEQIANTLHASLHTIKTHRRSIRRKLGLQNSDVNLSSYLKFKLGKELTPHLKN